MSREVLIAFDVDGTLVDSFPKHAEAEMRAAEELGVEIDRYSWAHFKGMNREELWSCLASDDSIEWQEFDRLSDELFNTLLNDPVTPLLPISGAEEFLVYARMHSLMMAQVTSSVRSNLDAMNHQLGWKNKFITSVAYDEARGNKPTPYPYLEVASRLQLPVKKVVVIEDSPQGVSSAKAAGCYCVGITTYCNERKLYEVGAQKVVASYKELAVGLHSILESLDN